VAQSIEKSELDGFALKTRQPSNALFQKLAEIVQHKTLGGVAASSL